MANRCDSHSKLPRQLKRQLTLTSTLDAHRDGEIRRIMMGAHDHARRVREKMLRAKDNVNVAEEEKSEVSSS